MNMDIAGGIATLFYFFVIYLGIPKDNKTKGDEGQ